MHCKMLLEVINDDLINGEIYHVHVLEESTKMDALLKLFCRLNTFQALTSS